MVITLRNIFILGLIIGFQNIAKAQSDSLRSNVGVTDSTKSGYKSQYKMGSPTNKENELELNDYAVKEYRYDLKYMDGWYATKKKINEKTGLKYSINYSSMYLGASSRIDESKQQNAAGGILDLILIWDVFRFKNGVDFGGFVFWTDWRHNYYGDVPVSKLNFDVGSATLPAVLFNNWSPRVVEFYYQQSFFKKRMGLVAGKIDLGDWFAYNGLAHPLLHFTDLVFSVSPTVSWSNMGLGIAGGGWIDKDRTVALLIGAIDVAGDDVSKRNYFDIGASQFFSGNLLKMAEFQFTPKRAKYYTNRLSATIWHSDELTVEDESFFTSPSSKGFALEGTWTFTNKHITALTFGLSDGKGANALSKINASAMHGINFENHDLFAAGINYTKSTISDENQFLTEVFYRWTWSKTTSITPVIKLVVNPALNPNVDLLVYYGIRGRVSL